MTGGSEMSVELFDEGEVWADEEDLLGSEEDLGVEVLSPEEAVSYIQHADSSPLYEHYRVIADKGQALLRVDKFLASRMTGSSRSRIQQALDGGYVFVNGVAVKANYRIKPQDVVTLQLRRPKHTLEIVPEDIPLEIVYEDPYLLVVNKPAGLVVHPGHGNYSGTLVNALAYYLKDDPHYDPADPCVGLVHRIDKDTSGLLVVAKRPETKTHLARQFFEKTTHRSYRALVWGRFTEPQGTIIGNIGRDERDRLQMAVYPEGSERGKRAVTHYEVLEELAYVSWVECRLETGRTHQIRAHMKHIGHPLFADVRYGGDKILWGNQFSRYKQFVQNCFALCPRQALHAKTLGFVHPETGEELLFDSELPSDLSTLLDRWRTYAAHVADE